MHPALESEGQACGGRERRTPDQGPQQDRVGRGQRGAENRGAGGRQAEQEPGGEGDERGRQDRARPQHEQREPALLPHFADVDGDGVAEQHQHQRQRGEDLERLGDSSENSTTPSPAGPSMAPRRRKIATWGTPDRSTAPDSSEATMMTTPMSASAATKGSWNMVLIMAAHWRSPPAAW